MTHPLVSIISPVYNEASHIAFMIESVQQQTYDRWELVFVDDGSTDDTVSIIESYARNDVRIRLISKSVKLGKNAALNLAFQASSGLLLFMLSGDDMIPKYSIQLRVDSLTSHASEKALARFKFRMISKSSKFDGLVLPKGRGSSRTGASLTYTRELAEMLFPIPTSLPNEDNWLGYLAGELAERVVDSPSIAWLYRVHIDNSNPRHKSFPEMSDAIARRNAVWPLLLKAHASSLSDNAVKYINGRIQLEELRSRGKWIRMLSVRDIPLIDRLGEASMSRRFLFSVRMRLYRLFTGIREAKP